VDSAGNSIMDKAFSQDDFYSQEINEEEKETPREPILNEYILRHSI
jgi:hypothetical protein